MLTEEMKDWIFRYQYLFKNRYNKKKKIKFLHAFVSDLSKLTNKIKVISSNDGIQNIYVGDIHKAKRVICTGYDTPLKFIGEYVYFNKKINQKKFLAYIYLKSILVILIGLIGVLLWNLFMPKSSFFSIQSLLISILAVIYFIYLSKISKGEGFKYTLIRNTSSVLFLLNRIKKGITEGEAYAFIDETCLGDKG